MNIEQLKSKAYDCLVQIEMWQKQLKEVNEQIGQFKPEVSSSKDVKYNGGKKPN